MMFKGFPIIFIATLFGLIGCEVGQLSEEQIIRNEIERFKSIQDLIKDWDMDLSVYFHVREKDDEDFLTGKSVVQLRSSKPKSESLLEVVSRQSLDKAFALAEVLNGTAVFSRERFSEDGTLVAAEVNVADQVKISYDNNVTKIVLEDRDKELTTDEELESFLQLIKDYEVRTEIRQITYKETGEVAKDETTHLDRKKVTILGAEGIRGNVQLKVAEAFKRTFEISKDSAGRIRLLSKFLGLSGMGGKWNGTQIDKPEIPNENHGWIKLKFEGETYTLWKK